MALRVIVVDDSLYMRTILKEALVSAGYEIVGEAANGEDAIDLTLSLKPDLVTLDNILPDMIGLDVLKVIREAGDANIKVVMISAVGQESVIKEGMDLGASEYIVKPFTNEDLIEKIKKVTG
jgi:two-component system chemotaxis response regulator CheY